MLYSPVFCSCILRLYSAVFSSTRINLSSFGAGHWGGRGGSNKEGQANEMLWALLVKGGDAGGLGPEGCRFHMTVKLHPPHRPESDVDLGTLNPTAAPSTGVYTGYTEYIQGVYRVYCTFRFISD